MAQTPRVEYRVSGISRKNTRMGETVRIASKAETEKAAW